MSLARQFLYISGARGFESLPIAHCAGVHKARDTNFQNNKGAVTVQTGWLHHWLLYVYVLLCPRQHFPEPYPPHLQVRLSQANGTLSTCQNWKERSLFSRNTSKVCV